MRTIRIQTEEFDVSAEIAAMTKDHANVGAVVTFTGHVRADDGLTALTLEHYPGMTEEEIARQSTKPRNAGRFWARPIIHRIGKLAPGDPIVLVAVARHTARPRSPRRNS